ERVGLIKRRKQRQTAGEANYAGYLPVAKNLTDDGRGPAAPAFTMTIRQLIDECCSKALRDIVHADSVFAFRVIAVAPEPADSPADQVLRSIIERLRPNITGDQTQATRELLRVLEGERVIRRAGTWQGARVVEISILGEWPEKL